LQLGKTGHVPWWATKVLALELFAKSGQKEAVACNWGKLDMGRGWEEAGACICGRPTTVARRTQVLAFVENWNATVVSNKGACIGVVHRCDQKEAGACICGKLDTPVVGEEIGACTDGQSNCKPWMKGNDACIMETHLQPWLKGNGACIMEAQTQTVGRQRVLASGVELHTRGGENAACRGITPSKNP